MFNDNNNSHNNRNSYRLLVAIITNGIQAYSHATCSCLNSFPLQMLLSACGSPAVPGFHLLCHCANLFLLYYHYNLLLWVEITLCAFRNEKRKPFYCFCFSHSVCEFSKAMELSRRLNQQEASLSTSRWEIPRGRGARRDKRKEGERDKERQAARPKCRKELCVRNFRGQRSQGWLTFLLQRNTVLHLG